MGFIDNNQSRIVSICFLDCAMPPFNSMEAETVTGYVEQLSDIPEEELRMVIYEGVSRCWYSMPTIEDIRQLWRDMYIPIADLWN